MDRRRVWWVNHGIQLEIGNLLPEIEKEAGMIWIPLEIGENDLHQSEIMNQISVGDLLLHYVDGKLQSISRATSALEEHRPRADLTELGRAICVESHPLQPAIEKRELVRLFQALPEMNASIPSFETEEKGTISPFPIEALRLLYMLKKDGYSWSPYVKELFEDRKYWIFQCNPRKFAFQKAVQDGVRSFTWKVSAHGQKICPGDKVIIWMTGKDGGCSALGTVCSEVGNYPILGNEKNYYLEEAPQELIGCLVELDYVFDDLLITKKTIQEHPVLATMLVGNRGTNFTATLEQYEAILERGLLKWKKSRRKTISRPTYTLAQLAEETYLSESELTSWLKQIKRKKQAIFYGPPGVGKTYLAEKWARYFTESGRGFTEIVQFHPSYSYEDFIQGIRPQIGKTGELIYTMQPGIFLRLCERARQTTDPCVLIIDEINRADIARVFGELLYALEYRDQEIQLASGTLFSVPNNLIILGTMNTLDRSIALVDHALRRRFSLIRISPNYDVLRGSHSSLGKKIDPLIAILQEVNQQIGDPQQELGISYFLVPDLLEQLEGIWRMEIEPYLEEIFLHHPEMLQAYCWEKIKKRVKL
jgi:MoxR-like ATPase